MWDSIVFVVVVLKKCAKRKAPDADLVADEEAPENVAAKKVERKDIKKEFTNIFKYMNTIH